MGDTDKPERVRDVHIEKDKIIVIFKQLVYPLEQYKELKRVVIPRTMA